MTTLVKQPSIVFWGGQCNNRQVPNWIINACGLYRGTISIGETLSFISQCRQRVFFFLNGDYSPLQVIPQAVPERTSVRALSGYLYPECCVLICMYRHQYETPMFIATLFPKWLKLIAVRHTFSRFRHLVLTLVRRFIARSRSWLYRRLRPESLTALQPAEAAFVAAIS